MNKNVFILFIMFLIFIKGFSQQLNKYNFEAGLAINTPLLKGERIQSNGESTTSFDWTYKYYNSTGYFFKIGFDAKLTSKNKWNAFFPVGISFLSTTIKYHRDGYTMGCFGGESANEMKNISNKIINLFFGPALQLENKQYRVVGNIIFNNCLNFNSKAHSTPVNPNDTYFNKYDQFKYNLYLSSQLIILYNIKKNIWIGPSCEIFYGNGLYLFRKFRDSLNKNNTRFTEYNDPTNITGKNIWINPAIKLQIDINN